jgi:hypothetical protein
LAEAPAGGYSVQQFVREVIATGTGLALVVLVASGLWRRFSPDRRSADETAQ